MRQGYPSYRRTLSKSNTGRLLAAFPFLAAGSWLTYSAVGINHNMDLPFALPTDRISLHSPTGGHLNIYVDTQASGHPLVLIHSINAAASAYEMRPLFLHYQKKRPLWAPDLPGFGFSSRGDHVYTPLTYEQALLKLFELQIGVPADVVALSLSAEFAARAALIRPSAFRSLTLISPTGFGNQIQPSHHRSDGIQSLLYFPLWSQGFYDLLTTRLSIRYFLQKSFIGPVDEEMVDYAYCTAHRPGARYAPFHFVSGELFTADIRNRFYARLTELPVLVLYDQDAYTGFEHLPTFLEDHPNWQSARISPTRGLPHFEKLTQTVHYLDTFWQTLNEQPSV